MPLQYKGVTAYVSKNQGEIVYDSTFFDQDNRYEDLINSDISLSAIKGNLFVLDAAREK